jgi:hypothetical protein
LVNVFVQDFPNQIRPGLLGWSWISSGMAWQGWQRNPPPTTREPLAMSRFLYLKR